MADTTTELEVLDQIVDVLGGTSGQYETVVPVLQQIKELLASGITDPEAIAEAVAAWLDEHPEATTTVRDGSITGVKLAQDVIGLLDNKADIDGYYSQLTAGLAENLIGRGDAVPAEYLYRTAGGTADIEDGIATIDCIKGNTLVWNQLFPALNSISVSGITMTANGDGSYTLNGTATADFVSSSMNNLTLVVGHKYLVLGESGEARAQVYDTAGHYAGSIFTSIKEGCPARIVVLSGKTVTNAIVWPQVFDLTLMFGAGNEPSTVAEFEAMFPLPYYPYSAPKLLPVDIRGIETVGFNAYNSSTGEAELLGGHQYQISGTYTSLSYSTGESIALDSDGIFTPSENGTLTVTGGNATDTCVHLVWSGYRNGEYEEHWSAERPIDTSRFFPTGLKKVGDKADALYADHYDTVIGTVDLGTLTWYKADDIGGAPVYYATLANVAAAANNDVVSASCSALAGVAASYLYTHPSEMNLISLNTQKLLWARHAADNAAAFKTAMSGVILYYELATPTTTPIDPPLNLSYKVSDFGTERIMVDETADAPQTAPVPMEVEYGINAIDTIRRLPTEYQSHKSMGQFTAALESSFGIDITETWDETEQRYEYEVSDFEIADNSIPDAKLVQTGGVLSKVELLGEMVFPFEKMTKDYTGNTRFDGYAGTTGLVSNGAYRTWYFTATRDFDAYFGDNGYASNYVTICVYSGSPSAATFVRKYSLSDTNLPTIDDRAHFLSGQVVAITIQAGAAYSYTLMQNMTSVEKFYLSDNVVLANAQVDQANRPAKVMKSGNSFNVYLPLKRGTGYAFFNLRKNVSPTINEDTWRLYEFCVVEEDFYPLWTPQQDIEWEGVVKESGTSDFVGGYHGDENLVAASIKIDGSEVDLSEDFELKAFREMEIVVTSLINRCDTPNDNLFTRHKVIKVADNTLSIENRWIALQQVTFEKVYLSMLSIATSDGGAKYCRNNDSWATQSTLTSTPVDGSPYNGSTYATQIEFYGDEFMARATILDNNYTSITTATSPTNMFVSVAQTNTAKMYFESGWPSSVAVDDYILCKTLYEFI